MKKLLKVLVIAAGGLVVVVIVAVIYFNMSYPKSSPPSNVKVEITTARIERGKYLANHVTVCIDCHSTRDWNKYSGPVIPGTEGKGGEVFNEKMGLPGVIYSMNITPFTLKNWSDGEIMRAITTGVTKDNTKLFPLMPYMAYNHLSQNDLYSIVAYIRTLKPIESKTPERQLNFPLNLIVKTFPPETYAPPAEPSKTNMVEYGKYLTTIAACADCHTPLEKGQPVKELTYAGGREFNMPAGIVRTANLTPDKNTGLGEWTKDDFISRFKMFAPDSSGDIPVKPGEFNTVMPWTMYAGMTDEDLGAVYTYLHSLKPIKHAVVKFTPRQ